MISSIVQIKGFLFVFINQLRICLSCTMIKKHLFYVFSLIEFFQEKFFFIKLFKNDSVLNSYKLCDCSCCKCGLNFVELLCVCRHNKSLNILGLWNPLIRITYIDFRWFWQMRKNFQENINVFLIVCLQNKRISILWKFDRNILLFSFFCVPLYQICCQLIIEGFNSTDKFLLQVLFDESLSFFYRILIFYCVLETQFYSLNIVTYFKIKTLWIL